MALDDRDYILQGGWETCCLKKKPKEGERTPPMGYVAYGVITDPRAPLTVYLRGETPRDDFKAVERYDSVDAMLAEGWVVD